ncbi:hypothetical protein ACFXJ8_02425 [Nonomuraea sp. NPDC059194]|uniref:hypothetical protein n=1 Tax=Nonomuraea sp. NPDC059194 TaxID=3346764 RepID=UPI00368801DB
MAPDELVADQGGGRRAALALAALGVSVLTIYAIFSSGFGRVATSAVATPAPPTPIPSQAPTPTAPGITVVADNFWLTYLPPGLTRTGGGAVEPEPGVEGGWARYAAGSAFVEVQVEHGTVAADWDTYRQRATVTSPRETTVRGKPAVVGRHPSGGMMIVWLERTGTGAWIRVSDTLAESLTLLAASVRSPA